MPWVRIADDFPDHPKVVRAGVEAAWLYVCGLAYSNRYATDGLIPSVQVRRLADVADATRLADRLVEVGLWERAADGYQIHDYGEYQPSADDIKRERDAAAKRQAEYRKRRALAREEARNGVSNGVSNADVTASPRATGAPEPGPVPARPGPVKKHPSDVSVARGARKPPAAAKNQPWNDEDIYGKPITVQGIRT